MTCYSQCDRGPFACGSGACLGVYTACVHSQVITLWRGPRAPFLRLQAKKLDEMLAKRGQTIDSVLNFQVPDQLLVGGEGRWRKQAWVTSLG